jgi:hypothetical protein
MPERIKDQSQPLVNCYANQVLQMFIARCPSKTSNDKYFTDAKVEKFSAQQHTYMPPPPFFVPTDHIGNYYPPNRHPDTDHTLCYQGQYLIPVQRPTAGHLYGGTTNTGVPQNITDRYQLSTTYFAIESQKSENTTFWNQLGYQLPNSSTMESNPQPQLVAQPPPTEISLIELAQFQNGDMFNADQNSSRLLPDEVGEHVPTGTSIIEVRILGPGNPNTCAEFDVFLCTSAYTFS